MDRWILGMDKSTDLIANLLRAGGRRAAPSAEDRDYVFDAAFASWRRTVRARRQRRWMAAVAAGFAIMAVAYSVIERGSGDDPGVVAQAALLRGELWSSGPHDSTWRHVSAGTPVDLGARLRTGAGTGAALLLSDGASIRLRAATTVVVESRSHVRLDSGGIYIDTGPGGRSQPIKVLTDWGTVNDLGTVFEVERTSSELRVRVREGRIRLERGGERGIVESGAGQELAVDAGGAAEVRNFPTTGAEWAWAEALAVAPESDDQPLLQFLEWVARETGRRLRFDEPGTRAQAAAVRLHGSARNLGPLDALTLMLETTDFEFRLQGESEIVIYRRHVDRG
jgi:ferric-dicitrate binding protein FerR (iron transport regulator)